MSDSIPTVSGRDTKDAGRYMLGTKPQGLAHHNLKSWRIIEAMLEARGSVDYYDLAVAVRGHEHGTKAARGPQSFVSYCIRRGWLRRM
jgi:hypothetical protein